MNYAIPVLFGLLGGVIFAVVIGLAVAFIRDYWRLEGKDNE